MMKHRIVVAGVAVVALGLIGAGCQSGFAARFVPRLYSFTILPAAGGGAHTVEPGGSVEVRAEVRMGVGVSGEDIEVSLLSLPAGLALPIADVGLRFPGNLAAEESTVVSFVIEADPSIAPGSYQVTIESSVDVIADSEEFSEGMDATLTVVVRAPGTAAPDDNGATPGDGSLAGNSCEQYVAHYNALACVSEPLTVSNTCSESVSEFCTGEEAFNACRIENTFCQDGTLVQTVESCFELLDCDG